MLNEHYMPSIIGRRKKERLKKRDVIWCGGAEAITELHLRLSGLHEHEIYSMQTREEKKLDQNVIRCA